MCHRLSKLTKSRKRRSVKAHRRKEDEANERSIEIAILRGGCLFESAGCTFPNKVFSKERTFVCFRRCYVVADRVTFGDVGASGGNIRILHIFIDHYFCRRSFRINGD